MEVISLKGCSSIVEKPTNLSNYCQQSEISIPGRPETPQQESDECNHFTIRGFVSEVRKRNAKICWPFSIHDQRLDDYLHVQRPLQVKKFRRWSCQSCLHKTIGNSETSITDGANMIDPSDGMKSRTNSLLRACTVSSHRETAKSANRLQQQSEENSQQRVAVLGDGSTRMSTDGQCPILCRKKRVLASTSDLIKGVTTATKSVHNKWKENKNLSGKSNVVAAEKQAFQTRERGKGKFMAKPSTLEIPLHFGDAPRSLSSKRERNGLVRQTGTSGTSLCILRSLSFPAAASGKEHDQELYKTDKKKEVNRHVAKSSMPQGLDVTVATDASLDAPLAYVLGMDERSDEASDTSTRLISNMFVGQDDARRAEIHVEKQRHRKYRKIRTLEDIMKSKETLNEEKNCISSGNACPIGSGNVEAPATSKQTDENSNHGFRLIQDTESAAVKSKNKTETIQNDGGRTCLVQWMRKVPRKGSLHKGEGEHMRIITPRLAAVKGLDLNLEFSGQGESNQEIVEEKKQDMMAKVEVLKTSSMAQEDCTAPMDHAITGDVRNVISEKETQRKRNTPSNSYNKTPKVKKKNKRPIAENGTSDQRFFKGSLGTQKQPVFQEKKQKSTSMTEQKAADDIPMDIVELLAKKQHERRLMSSVDDNAHMNKGSEMTQNMIDSRLWGDNMVARGSNVSEAANRCFSQEGRYSVTGCSAFTSVGNEDSESWLRPSNSFVKDKQCHQFDLNQEAPVWPSSELRVPSPYIGLSASFRPLSVIDCTRSYPSKPLSTNGMKMPFFSSDHMDEPILHQNLFSNAHNGSYRLLTDYSPQINAQSFCSDVNCFIMCSAANQKSLAHNAGYQIYQSKDMAESSTSTGAFAANPFGQSGNGYHSNMMWPVELCNNENISASNLLRLIQQSARSGEPYLSSRNNDTMGYIKAFNTCGLATDINDTTKLSGACVNRELDKQAESPHKPVRPLPRIGVLGPLLQKEITNTSDHSTLTLGFGAGNPSELTLGTTSFAVGRGIEKARAGAFTVAPLTNAPNVQAPMLLNEGFDKNNSSVISSGNARCSPAKDIMGQAVTSTRDGAFRPIRSTCQMEECVVNRNPADFAMVDEDCEYMIGYEETKTQDMPTSGDMEWRTLSSQKVQKMRKLNDLNHHSSSNYSSLSQLSCFQIAK